MGGKIERDTRKIDTHVLPTFRANISKFYCVKNRRKFAMKKATNYDCDDDGNKLRLQL